MICSCPKCGQTTRVDSDLQSFLDRCTHCGALLKPPTADSPKPRATLMSVGRWQAKTQAACGALSMLLSPQPALAAIASTGSGSHTRVLRPESLREIARASARQRALQKAQLRANLQALKTLAVLGILLVGLLLLGAAALQVRAFWNSSHPAPPLRSHQHPNWSRH